MNDFEKGIRLVLDDLHSYLDECKEYDIVLTADHVKDELDELLAYYQDMGYCQY